MNFVYQIIYESNFDTKYKLRAINLISHLVNKVNFGQVMDVLLAEKNHFSQSEIELIHRYKTATYTGEMPILSGAILGEADKQTLKQLTKFAVNTGKAFQIQDDIIGLFGNEAQTGKPITSDLEEGKKTLLLFKALSKASAKEKKCVSNTLKKRNITKSELEKVRQIVIRTGSLDYSKSLAEKLAHKAIREIKKTNIKVDAKNKLIEITRYIITRKK